MNRAAAIQCFHDYTGRYDPDNPLIRHKIVHTLHVAELSERIARSLGLDDDDVDFAWFLGLLHDIGRFEQVRRYGTFVDSQSVDHAEFGADLLFRDGLFRSFPTDQLPQERRDTAETAIRLHNKLSLPDNLDGETQRFAQILRDAERGRGGIAGGTGMCCRTPLCAAGCPAYGAGRPDCPCLYGI